MLLAVPTCLHPQTVAFVLRQNVSDILAVRRDGRPRDLAVIRQATELQLLKRRVRLFPVQESVQTESQGEQSQDNKRTHGNRIRAA